MALPLKAEAALPDIPFFRRLFQAAGAQNDTIIYDSYHAAEAGYDKFLCDIIAFRQVLRDRLPPEIVNEKGIIIDGKEVYICTFLPSCYDFFVVFFAILAIGGIVVPITAGMSIEEALYYINKCKGTLLVAHPDLIERATEIQHQVKLKTERDIGILNTKNILDKANIPPSRPHVDQDIVFHVDRPAIVMYTSGSTGKPKGILHSLRYYRLGEWEPPSPGAMFLCHRSMHLGMSIQVAVTSILNGIPIRILGPDSNFNCVWEAIRKHKPTVLIGTPYYWSMMMKHFNEHIDHLPVEEKDQYIEGARCLRNPICGGSTPVPALRAFWKRILGFPLTLGYGSTETSTLTVTPPDMDFTDKRAIGEPYPDIDVKLSEGDYGEMLIKCPTMFLRYLDNEAATRAAFNDDGYYKSGDQCHVKDGIYFMDGRSNDDFFKYKEVRVRVPDLEESLLELEYITEAYVLPIPDISTGHRIAVLIRSNLPFVKSNRSSDISKAENDMLSFQKLRSDLVANGLTRYILPNLLRVLYDGEKVPRSTTTFKPLRKEMVKIYFPQSKECLLEDLPSDVQIWDIGKDPQPTAVRA